MIALTLHAIRARLRSTAIWGVSVGLVSGLLLGAYLVYDPASLAGMMDTLTPEIRDAFGIPAGDAMGPDSFMAMEFLNYAPLVVGFYAISAGAQAIAGREQDRSLDLVAAQPIERRAVPLASLLATTAGLLIVLGFYVAFTSLSALGFGIDLAFADVVLSAIGLVPITLLYGALALAASAVLRSRGAVSGVCGGLLVTAYLADAISLAVPDLDWLQWFTPFYYYGSPIQDGITVGHQALLLAGAAVFALVSVVAYERRDIQA